MNNSIIEYIFPKSVLVADNICHDEIDMYKTKIHNIFSSMGYNTNEFLGVSSTHSTSNQLHTMPEFQSLVEEIYNHVYDYLKNMGYSDDFISRVKIAEMWANRSFANENLQTHVHPNCLLSGAYYVESSTESKLVFSDLSNMMPEPETFTETSMNVRWYEAKPGRMIIFKSDMPHGTNQQTFDNRIVISFNLK